MSAIAWMPWSAAAFARARAEARPVLLAIGAPWSRCADEMDRTSYADPGVAAVVARRFVPVRVNADQRPDISDRYALGGLPTTSFLTPEGEVIGGGTYVAPARLRDVLQQVYDAFAEGRHARARPPVQPPPPPAAVSPDRLVALVAQGFDASHGGFGDWPKFPHAAPVRLALELHAETGAGDVRDMAIRSLDAMGWGPLYDARHGGFFRCCQGADWSVPEREKLLDVNASLLSLYLTAFEVLQLARYGERADDVLRYVQTWLADPVDGGWAGSQRPAPEGGAAGSSAGPAGGAADGVDRTLYAGWNALMASAALHAGGLLQDASLSEFAIRSLERIVLLCYRPGGGVARYVDGGPQARGLLEDQIAVAAAHLDAFEATGNVVYEMMAEELALYAIRVMWDEAGDGFLDRAPDGHGDVGLLSRPYKPFAANCAAARLLFRLAGASGSARFAGYARRTLAAMSPRAAAEGPLAAEYVLAARALREG